MRSGGFERGVLGAAPQTRRTERGAIRSPLLLATAAMVALAVSVVVAASVARSPQGDAAEGRPARVEAVRRALDNASHWMNNGRDSYSTSLVWLVSAASTRASSEALDAMVEYSRRTAVADPLSAMVGGAPEDVAMFGEGQEQHPVQLLIDAVPRCKSDEREKVRLWEFLREDHDGYLQTHQLLFAHWAELHGCNLGPAWPDRRSQLLERVDAELAASEALDDLVVEQLAVVALESPTTSLDDRWVAALLAAQNADGSFGDEQVSSISYRGASIPQMLGPAHMTPLAIFVLASALAN